MSKTSKGVLGGIAAVLGVAAIAWALYATNSSVRSAIDKIGAKSSDSSAAASASVLDPTSFSSFDGTVKLEAAKGTRFAAAVGSFLSFICTLTPADVTDKTVVWTVGDPSKVSLSSATSVSGSAVKLTLLATFSGPIALTAAAHVKSTVKAICNVYCPNAVGSVALVKGRVGDVAGVSSADYDATIVCTPAYDVPALVSGDGYYSRIRVSNLSGKFDFYRFVTLLSPSSHRMFADFVFEVRGAETDRLPDSALAYDFDFDGFSGGAEVDLGTTFASDFYLTSTSQAEYSAHVSGASAFFVKHATASDGVPCLYYRVRFVDPLSSGLYFATFHYGSVYKSVCFGFEDYVAPTSASGLADQSF